jgi:hypothetical protein
MWPKDAQPGTQVSGISNDSSFNVAVDAQNIYWGDTSSNLIGQPLAGGSPFTIATDIGRFVSNGTNFYWTTANSVVSEPVSGLFVDGGAPTVTWATATMGGLGITVDSTDVYWTGANVVQKAPLAGGPVTTIATTSGPYCVVVDATSAYYTAGGGGCPSSPGILVRVTPK